MPRQMLGPVILTLIKFMLVYVLPLKFQYLRLLISSPAY